MAIFSFGTYKITGVKSINTFTPSGEVAIFKKQLHIDIYASANEHNKRELNLIEHCVESCECSIYGDFIEYAFTFENVKYSIILINTND